MKSVGIKTKLQSWKRKTISKSDLENLLHTSSDAELYSLVSDAVDDGLLSPINASGINGNRSYPIYLKYRITLTNDYSEVLARISMLHPAITKTGYLQAKPELYLKYEDQFQKLNRYLFQTHPSISVSKKERSFEIFDEEKLLDDSSFHGLLEHLELTSEVLCYYETPEYCFNDYIPERKGQMTLLICENKDIWFNIRRRMYEDFASTIFETHIDGVVYGSGNKVSEVGALSAYTKFMDTDNVRYLYWGDIDRAGLSIYLSLIKNNPELDIQLFIPAYEQMLCLAESRSIPDSADHRERVQAYGEIYELFSAEMMHRLSEYIDANKRIPQEIISYEKLLEVMR